MKRKTWDYKLVEHYYRNRIEWEDGPGSLQNVVADESTRVVRTWVGETESFGAHLIKNGYSGLNRNSDDGWDEYSYYLHRRQSANEEWRLVGFVSPPDEQDEEEY